MALVILPVERPLDLIGVENGNLPIDVMVTVPGGGRLHHLAARSWASLCRCAAAAGWQLTYTPGGCYRSYASQEALFRSRYTTTKLAGRPTKQWLGWVWYQYPNTAAAAVPGTSNHGLALAIDTALGPDPGHATAITPALGWLEAHAPRFGFSWEGPEDAIEPWHIRLVTGDNVPRAVIDWEPRPPAPDPPNPNPNPNPPPTPLQEDDMAIRLISQTKGEWIWTPGGWPQPFKTAADRDAIVNAGKYEAASITDEQLVALFSAERPAP